MTEISEQVDMDNKTIKELKQKRQKMIKSNVKGVFTLVPTALFFPGIFLCEISLFIEISTDIIEGLFIGFLGSTMMSALLLTILCIYCLENDFHPVNYLKGLINKILKNKTELKGLNKEINKRKIIDKIKDINQKKETNGINIDSKKQQEIDKLLNKLKKMLEQEEYQSTVDDIFNERVQLKDDEYTITEEKTANIGSGSIAYAYPKDNIVKKKVLVRK